MRRFALLLLLALTAACGITPIQGGSSPSPGASPDVVQDLTLQGKIADRWTAVDVTCTPLGDSLEVRLTQTRNNNKLILTLAVTSGYEGVGDYQNGLGPSGKPATVQVKLAQADKPDPPVALSTSSLPVGLSVTQKTPPLGSIDARLGQVADTYDVAEIVTGHWRCP